MKIILNVVENRKPRKNDIIVWNDFDKCWTNITQEQFLRGITNELKAFKSEINNLVAENEIAFKSLKNGVNDKLKEYHDILQNLTKENE